jgi:hypothetical protein
MTSFCGLQRILTVDLSTFLDWLENDDNSKTVDVRENMTEL